MSNQGWFEMKEKILAVLVAVCLILTAFNLVLLFRTNGTDILNSSNTVTWKKVQCEFDSYGGGSLHVYYLAYDVYSSYGLLYPLFNVTLTVQWFLFSGWNTTSHEPIFASNGTTSYLNVGTILLNTQDAFPEILDARSNVGNAYSNYPDSMQYSPFWNITSVTALVLS